MYYSNRLSRIAHPRSTPVAMILLTVVFLGFGLWVQAHAGATPTVTVEHTNIDTRAPQADLLSLVSH